MTSTAPSDQHTEPDSAQEPAPSRRLVLGLLASLAAAYGTFAAFVGRFLYPANGPERSWLFVMGTGELGSDEAVVFRTPNGSPVNITRLGPSDDDIVALSSTCPHLGCQVHWEAHNSRYFCPCHNGIFDTTGKATGGPPAEAGQSLLEYPVKVEDELVFIELSSTEIAMGPGSIEREPAVASCPWGPGQDPCLFPAARQQPARAVDRSTEQTT